jgi:NAD(P)H-nitrite reductase large subunit
MMNTGNSAPNPDEILVCFCHGVPEPVIRQAIKDGAKTLEDVKKATRASTGCGGCTCEVERILAEALAE